MPFTGQEVYIRLLSGLWCKSFKMLVSETRVRTNMKLIEIQICDFCEFQASGSYR